MSGFLIVLIVLIGIPLLLVIWVVGMYNGLVGLRNRYKNAFAQIDVQLKRRYDLVPNLVETVKGYKIYEKDVLTRIVKLRVEAGQESHPEARGKIEGDLAQNIGRLFALAENYPDLKASKVYLDLQEKLTEVEDHLQYARRYYNGTVRNLNIYVQSFPSNLVAAIFGFKRAEYFQLDAPEEGLAPDVKLAS